MSNSHNIFQHDKLFTIGVEEEYMLCDPNSGELIDRADEIMGYLEESLKPRYSYELILSEIEVNTSVCISVNEVMQEISFLRNNTKKLGEILDFRIGISGTHPTARCKDQSFVQNESYNWVSEQLNYYARRNITFAMHVHIAVKDEHYAISIANALRQWIAPLLALSTNSPFFEGENTGMRSSRTMQFGVFPRTNIPARFNNFDEYKNLIDNYLSSDTIAKPRQIWWKIRPHMDFGTIEFRICDVQRSLKNVEMITAICQALVYQASIDLDNRCLLESFNMEYLNDGLWKATRFPLKSQIIDPETNQVCTLVEQINKMKSYINDALKYWKNHHINEYIDLILMHGTEGDQQLKVYEESGFESLKQYLMKSVEYDYK